MTASAPAGWLVAALILVLLGTAAAASAGAGRWFEFATGRLAVFFEVRANLASQDQNCLLSALRLLPADLPNGA